MKIKHNFLVARHVTRALILVLFLFSLFLLGRVTPDGLAAAAATRTPTRRPTLTPTPRKASFSAGTGNKTNPGGVLQQLFVGGLGGGGGSPDDCSGSAIAPYLSSESDSSQEVFAENYLFACGWTEDERIDVRIQYPDGRIVKRQITADKDAGVFFSEFEFKPAWTDPIGMYRVTFSGRSGQVTADVRVYRPTEPRVVVFEDQTILLHRFSPNENVRLFAYGDCGPGTICLKAWQAFQVDRQGSLQLNLGSDLSDTQLFIVGERSGEFGDVYGFAMEAGSHKLVKKPVSKSTVLVSTCPGAPPQRFKIGWYGKVCTKVDRVKVRQGPSRSAQEIVRLEPGTSFSVVEGPSCADNWSWYKIKFAGNQTGWVAEGGDSTDPYFICPE